jgi:hypothetical protein
MKNMTSKKNMSSNRTPRRIDRNAGGRKKGVLTSLIKKHYGNKKKMPDQSGSLKLGGTAKSLTENKKFAITDKKVL